MFYSDLLPLPPTFLRNVKINFAEPKRSSNIESSKQVRI